MKTGKKIVIFSSIIATLLAAANYYFAYMVASPDDVVKKFMNALDKNDYKTFAECLDSKFQTEFNLLGNVAGDLITNVTGFSFDFNTIMDLSSMYYNSVDTKENKWEATNFNVTSITGEKLNAFVETFGTKIPSIGNALGDEATVEFEVNKECGTDPIGVETADGKIKYTIKVKKI